MKDIVKFSNIMKYDSNRCTRCRKCLYACKNRALSLFNNEIELNNKKCVACKECIKVCENNALYYNVNDGLFEGDNVVAIVPSNVNKNLLTKKYGKIVTYELGEKVKVVETAFEMENLSSKKINDGIINPLIISDIKNFELILNLKFSALVKYYSKVKNFYYIASYLEKIQNKSKDIKISAYGVPFENKMYFENSNVIDEICDIPFKNNQKYNILDILNTYKELCKLETNINVDKIIVSGFNEICMWNKILKINILLINEISYLSKIEINKYDFIFVCNNEEYLANENLLKDEEINKLYKTKLKAPGKTISLYNKE